MAVVVILVIAETPTTGRSFSFGFPTPSRADDSDVILSETDP